jgi:hypothetical protein
MGSRIGQYAKDEAPSWSMSYKPDFYRVLVDGVYYIVEYENSSRGCVTHVAKYIDIARSMPECYFMVDIIRSEHHRQKHKQDAHLASVIALLSPKNLIVDFPLVEDEIDSVVGFAQHRINDWLRGCLVINR